MFAQIKRALDLTALTVLHAFGIDGHIARNGRPAKQATPKML